MSLPLEKSPPMTMPWNWRLNGMRVSKHCLINIRRLEVTHQRQLPMKCLAAPTDTVAKWVMPVQLAVVEDTRVVVLPLEAGLTLASGLITQIGEPSLDIKMVPGKPWTEKLEEYYQLTNMKSSLKKEQPLNSRSKPKSPAGPQKIQPGGSIMTTGVLN